MNCGGDATCNEGSWELAGGQIGWVKHGEEINWRKVQELNTARDEDANSKMLGGSHVNC